MALSHHPQLPDGTRVRIRLPQSRDRAGLVELSHRLGLDASGFEITRALSFDPRARAVLCASVWTNGTETLVGYGAMDVEDDEPTTLVADVRTAPGVAALLYDALRDAVDARRRAA